MQSVPIETFFLSPERTGTLQSQIRQMVTGGIATGLFPVGARLPSSRKLAEHLGISRITVSLAYADLVASDHLVSRGRSGYFVSENAPRPPEFLLPDRTGDQTADWSRLLGRRFAGRETSLRPADWRAHRYPFIYGQADAQLFDHHNWRNCALKALGSRDFGTLALDRYEQDDPMLVEQILRHILLSRGIRARPEEVLITMGAQNALWMAAEILLTQRRVAVHETPCYPGLRQILENTRCTTEALELDAKGLDPNRLPERLDVVFTTASHQCPTNVTMPMDRRRALLNLAMERGFVVVEDDYEFEIPFGAAPTPSLKAIDGAGVVIHVGSFSKSLFPGLRLGYLVADPAFIREARALRGLLLRHPPGHIQRTTAHFLALGYYDAQVNRMAKAYRRRRAAMEQALIETGLMAPPVAPLGGSSFWLKAPDGIDTTRAAKQLLEVGVVIEPGSVFFAEEDDNHSHMRLSYSSIPEDRIPEGIELMAQTLASSGHSAP